MHLVPRTDGAHYALRRMFVNRAAYNRYVRAIRSNKPATIKIRKGIYLFDQAGYCLGYRKNNRLATATGHFAR